jgi:adenylyltransferase/sulfurtransferase
MLTSADLARYRRQITLAELGVEGQEKLRRAQVLIVGAGGLGSPAALYLAAAGVGTLGVIDDDVVEVSNLHRQIVHGTEDIGRPKAASAADAVQRLNPFVHVRAHTERLTHQSARTIFADYDVIVDGCDNYPTRYAVNDACAGLGKVWIYGSVERFSGQVSVFGVKDGPCYRCLYPEPPSPGSTASCEEIGVLGAVPGVIGSLQAVETLKWITGVGQPLVGRLLQLDLLIGAIRSIEFHRRADCRACSSRPTETRSKSGNGADAVPMEIAPADLAQKLHEIPTPQLLDVREPWEWSLARLANAQLLQMGELEQQLNSLDRSRELVIYCHHGVRSAMAAEWLRTQGFQARSLAGGIDRWSCEIDPSVPRY